MWINFALSNEANEVSSLKRFWPRDGVTFAIHINCMDVKDYWRKLL